MSFSASFWLSAIILIFHGCLIRIFAFLLSDSGVNFVIIGAITCCFSCSYGSVNVSSWMSRYLKYWNDILPLNIKGKLSEHIDWKINLTGSMEKLNAASCAYQYLPCYLLYLMEKENYCSLISLLHTSCRSFLCIRFLDDTF